MKFFKLLVFLIAFFITYFVYGEEKQEINEYLNDCSESVLLTVPFYDKSSKTWDNSDIILKPGDMYRSVKNRNGYVFEKYGQIPEILANLEKEEKKFTSYCKDESEKIDKNTDLKNRREIYLSNTIPKAWCKKKISNFHGLKRTLEYKLSVPYDEEFLNSIKDEYISLTNITEEKVNLINDPLRDLDGDGINNIDEFLDDSNPLLKDTIRLSPYAIEVINDGSSILTGKFNLSNLSTTNIECFLHLYSRINDNGFIPKLECVDPIEVKTNRFGNMTISLNSNQKANFIILFDSRNIPRFLNDYYSFYVSWDNSDCTKSAFFYLSKTNPQKTKSVNDLMPQDRTLLIEPSNMKFSWSDDDHLFWDNDYKIQIIEYNNGFDEKSVCFTLTESNHAAEVTSDNMNSLSPGIYFWRVIKTTFNSEPTPSRWNSFLIGREIDKPVKTAITPFRGGVLGGRKQDWKLGEQKEIELATIENCVKVSYLYPLPSGLRLIQNNKDKKSSVFGVPTAAGRYTNIFVMVNSSGKTFKETHIISVYNQPDDVVSRSVYHVNKNEVIYDLTVNTNFYCKVKTYFNHFFAKDDNCKIKTGSKVTFQDHLPEGLKMTGDCDDYVIQGIPKKEGIFTNFLTVANGENRSQARHIFRIKNISEPLPDINKPRPGQRLPFIPFPGPPMFVKISPNKIIHTYNKGMVYKYDVRYDIAATVEDGMKFLSYIKDEKKRDANYYTMVSGKDNYKFKEKQIGARFLFPLRNDIELKKEGDNFFFYCYPDNLLNYTNYLIITNTEMTYTNMHVFQVYY